MATNLVEKFLLGTYDPDLVAILVTRRKKRKTNEEIWGESRYVCFDLLFLPPTPPVRLMRSMMTNVSKVPQHTTIKVCLTATVKGACRD